MTEFARSTPLGHLEARRSCQENTCYRPHTHEALSIGLIEDGVSVFSGQLGGSVTLRPDDVIIIGSGQVHQCNPQDGTWRYQMIHMDQEWVEGLTAATDADELFSGVTVLRHPDLRRSVSNWAQMIFADAQASHIESGLRRLLDDIRSSEPEFVVAHDADPALLELLAPVFERLRNDESNPSLNELASLVLMDRYQLVRAVKRATGLAPLAWRQNARITRARQMLRAGQGIAETASALGFTDQSHFHRVFRAHVAASPGSYRG